MEDKMIFQKLTPRDDMDLTVYEDAFEHIFSDTEIKNVAISGPYCAGKSSILKSFKKQNKNKNKDKNKKFLHISLAHFTNAASCNDSNMNLKGQEKENEIAESILEGKILNHLLQQINEKHIPQTSFHVKRSVSDKKCILYTVGIIVFVLCTLHLIYCRTWSEWVNSYNFGKLNGLLSITAHPFSRMISAFVVVILFGVGLFMLLKMQKDKNIFKKFSVKGNEIQLFSEEESSYFDKYLNEVLYIFENANVDVIVFEDLDRYNDIGIFTRLREINNLVNLRIQREDESKIIRFFYLLRDDMFESKDRTKFFDFILPVIPALDSSNSYAQLQKHIKESHISCDFKEEVLKNLASYLEDMRILKNVINEFIIYYNVLKADAPDPNTILTIVTYKNLFPKNFVEHHVPKEFIKKYLMKTMI